jgi:hypothetical protein
MIDFKLPSFSPDLILISDANLEASFEITEAGLACSPTGSVIVALNEDNYKTYT